MRDHEYFSTVYMKDGSVITISEGDGMNLFQEDVDAGYPDYIMWDYYLTQEDYENDLSEDGGQALTEKMVREMTEEEILDQIIHGWGLGRVEDIKRIEYR